MTTSRGNVDVLVAAIVQGRGITEAAELACMHRTTAWRHMKDPDVAAQIEAGRHRVRQSLTQWLDGLAIVSDLAMERIVELLDSPVTSPHVVARVASLVITERRQLIDVVDVAERLDRLESMLAGVDPDDPTDGLRAVAGL